jgi:plasmid stability protein
MKNVTITLDEEVARWARIRAAERETSVSRLVGEMLRDRMLEERSYEAAMHEYLARRPRKLRRASTPYPRRVDLYGR